MMQEILRTIISSNVTQNHSLTALQTITQVAFNSLHRPVATGKHVRNVSHRKWERSNINVRSFRRMAP